MIAIKLKGMIHFLTENPIIEVNFNKETNYDTSSEVLSLMNEGYLDGKMEDARDVMCSLKPDVNTGKPKSMKMVIHEFAPFTNSEEYCLYIESYEEPATCSGSNNFLTSIGPYESTSAWNFRMVINGSTAHMPKVRFWIAIASEYDYLFYIWY